MIKGNEQRIIVLIFFISKNKNIVPNVSSIVIILQRCTNVLIFGELSPKRT